MNSKAQKDGNASVLHFLLLFLSASLGHSYLLFSAGRPKGETSGMIYSSDRGPIITHDDSDHFGQFYSHLIPVSFMLSCLQHQPVNKPSNLHPVFSGLVFECIMIDNCFTENYLHSPLNSSSGSLCNKSQVSCILQRKGSLVI